MCAWSGRLRLMVDAWSFSGVWILEFEVSCVSSFFLRRQTGLRLSFRVIHDHGPAILSGQRRDSYGAAPVKFKCAAVLGGAEEDALNAEVVEEHELAAIVGRADAAATGPFAVGDE